MMTEEDARDEYLAVAKRFNAEYESRLGIFGNAQAAHRECSTLAAWAHGQGRLESRDWLVVLDEVIARFFEDDWAAGAKFPIRALAKDPGRYYVSRKARATESRAELGARIEALHVRAAEASSPEERTSLLIEAAELARGAR